MTNITDNLKKTLSRAAILMLPLLMLPLTVESGTVEPRLVCGAETEDTECEWAALRMCERDGEMLQDAMPILD